MSSSISNTDHSHYAISCLSYEKDYLSKSAEETINKICSFLNSYDIEVFVCLNKHLCRRGIIAANYHQTMLVRVFLRSCIHRFSHCQGFIVHIPDLTGLMKSIGPLAEPNLKEIKKGW